MGGESVRGSIFLPVNKAALPDLDGIVLFPQHCELSGIWTEMVQEGTWTFVNWSEERLSEWAGMCPAGSSVLQTLCSSHLIPFFF